MYDKILVAVDGSSTDQPVLEAAVALSRALHAEVRIVHVLESGYVGQAGIVNFESSDEAHQVVTAAIAHLDASSIRVSGAVRAGMHGRLAQEINEEGVEFGAGLVIVGSRGLSDLEGVFVGSTSHRLIHASHVPVLVVPQGSVPGT